MRTANAALAWVPVDEATLANHLRRKTPSTRAPLSKCMAHLTVAWLLIPPTNLARTSRIRHHILRTMILLGMSATMGNGWFPLVLRRQITVSLLIPAMPTATRKITLM